MKVSGGEEDFIIDSMNTKPPDTVALSVKLGLLLHQNYLLLSPHRVLLSASHAVLLLLVGRKVHQKMKAEEGGEKEQSAAQRWTLGRKFFQES